jgi:translation initiation factor 6
LGIYVLDVYRSPNIGIFLKTNDKQILIPDGLASTKAQKIASLLQVNTIRTSIGGSRLLGPLIVMNSRGVIVSRMTSDEELANMKITTGLPVERIPSKNTSVGNLIAANDKGAVVSTTFTHEIVARISDVLDVPVETMTVASYIQAGSMIIATNAGAVVHPRASESEISRIQDILKVNVEPATVNGGVPYVASGIVANSQAAVVGSVTSGPELIILSRALQL